MFQCLSLTLSEFRTNPIYYINKPYYSQTNPYDKFVILTKYGKVFKVISENSEFVRSRIHKEVNLEDIIKIEQENFLSKLKELPKVQEEIFADAYRFITLKNKEAKVLLLPPLIAYTIMNEYYKHRMKRYYN